MGPICRQHGKLGDTVAGKFDALASEVNRLPSPLPSDLVPPKPWLPYYTARDGHPSLASVGFLKSTEVVLILSTYSIYILEAYEDDSVQSGRGYSTFTMWTFLMTQWTCYYSWYEPASSSNWISPSCDRNCLHNRNGESSICQLYTLDWIFGGHDKVSLAVSMSQSISSENDSHSTYWHRLYETWCPSVCSL